MANDLNQFDIVLAAMSAMERQKEIEIEKLTARLEAEKAELFNIQKVKQVFSINRGSILIDELTLSKKILIDETDRRGTPENWLYPQYKRLGSRRAIEQVLEEKKEPVEIEDLARELYDTRSEDEFRRARNSLSAGLRRGAEEGFWQKVSRSFYQSNSIGTTDSAVSL